MQAFPTAFKGSLLLITLNVFTTRFSDSGLSGLYTSLFLGYNPLSNMNHQDLFKLLRTVHKNVRCPQCGRQYVFSDIKIRSIVDSVCFLELNCTDHMPLIATVFIDSNRQDNFNFKPIQSNDVIETHKILKDFSGGFEEMFNKR